MTLVRFQRVTRRDVLFFTEELSTLVRAGLPLDRSLRIVADMSGPGMRAVVEDVLRQIREGKSLADALAAHPRPFSRLYTNMVRAGEAGGVLDVILGRLAEFERGADDLRSYLKTSLIYPCLLAFAGLGSIGVLFYFVIPKFESIFDDLGVPVPPATQALLAVSAFTRHFWWVALLGLAAASAAFRAWVRTEPGHARWDRIKLRLPVLGPTLLKMEVARFARTLGTLTASAVPLTSAVRIVQTIARNRIVANGIAQIAAGARRGEGVARPMREAGVFPALSVHLVAVGEETGRLDSMLLEVAEVYEKDVRASVKALTAVFEPAIILVMGVVVGAVVLSVLTAILSINDIKGIGF